MTSTDTISSGAPSRTVRFAVAGVIGMLSGSFCWLALARPHTAPDFLVFWFHARTLLEGGNPYLTPLVLGPGRSAPFMYPLPAAMLVAPVAWLPMPVAGGLFLGASAALLAFAATRDGYYRLPLFLSSSFIVAATFGQWTPLVTAGALLPWLGGVALIKPNLGLATLAYRPSRQAIIGAAVLLLASLVIIPRWPLDWLHLVRTRNSIYRVPVATFAGFLLLTSAIRWRRPENRLVLLMACVPQLLFFYDQLPLWLVPRSLKQSALLTTTSLAAWLMWTQVLRPGVTVNQYIPAALPFVMAGIYLPALAIALWPVNVGRAEDPANSGAAVGTASRAQASPTT